ncbi:MAG: tRNA-intron lyase [Ignisphaera sp.]|uniref:tRNA-intron lyase n=1 Tax=Ignisphaera aggregans TaxID=334771 RepID=A0A7C4H2I9_9CREN
MAIYDKNYIAKIDVVGRKSLVLDKIQSNTLFKQFYGKPLSISKPKIDQSYQEPLVLSMYETLYLCKKGLAEVNINGESIDCNKLWDFCKSVSHDFDVKYRVYEYLRDRNYIIRGGTKYGADFTVYTVGPGYEHAPYVITVVAKEHKIKPTDIVALGRVSHSVRKHSVLAIVDRDDNNIRYIVFKWIKL